MGRGQRKEKNIINYMEENNNYDKDRIKRVKKISPN